jgi:hypothetical protein
MCQTTNKCLASNRCSLPARRDQIDFSPVSHFPLVNRLVGITHPQIQAGTRHVPPREDDVSLLSISSIQKESQHAKEHCVRE